MKILRIIKTKFNKEDHSLEFGIALSEKELEEMFRLRYKVYVSELGYGNEKFFSEEKEYDEYDSGGKCVYFLAALDKEIIGTARLVLDDPLPVEKDYFLFQEPLVIKGIPKNKIAEVSRVISRPSKFLFPRHFVILGLFDSMLQYCLENDIEVGYAAIEEPFKLKLEKLKIPFYLIENFSVKKSALTERFPGYFDQQINKLYGEPFYYEGKLNIENVIQFFSLQD